MPGILRKIFQKKSRTEAISRQAELRAAFPDFDANSVKLIETVEPYTMTSPERIESLRQSIQHLVRHGIEGDIIECGVWRGGSMMATALTLLQEGDVHRTLRLYDTFDGMSAAKYVDRDFLDHSAAGQLDQQDRDDPESIWCRSALSEVQQNMINTGYPAERLQFIKGKVEDTLPSNIPESIALLRLDTDWYESTRVCLEQLYPRLEPGGILIVDDYGHWKGCRKAVDEYFESHGIPLFLQRIDYTGRIAVKPDWKPASGRQRSA